MAAALALAAAGTVRDPGQPGPRVPEPKPMSDAEYAAAVNRQQERYRDREAERKHRDTIRERRRRKSEGTSLLDKARRAKGRP